jgi:hypothetical protein
MLRPPEWRDGSLFLYLGMHNDLAKRNNVKFCIKTLLEEFGATIGEQYEGPFTTSWSVHIEGVDFSLILDEDYGEIHLVSCDRADKNFVAIMKNISEKWPSIRL